MPKYSAKKHRKPRYKQSHRPNSTASIALFELPSNKPRHVVPLANGGRRYLISIWAAIFMPIAAIAAGGIFGMVYAAICVMLGLTHWSEWILFGLFWLWLTESWWFGLSTRKFADVYADRIVMYGVLGRKKYVFSRAKCTFYYIPHNRDITPALWVKRENRQFPIRVDNTLCADWEDFLFETGAVEILGHLRRE
ncbi:hypothetical protein [Wielerella bovis]|uniref:hypothetical protein n=1 Tax=Wielerella bovis TaxID=2917790 RepID=UPI002019DF14|nr:hypothetical protein [Wielerella bovis]ULJ60758.1 hypothetical protein MIS44_02505 [Wielerella bovis]